MSVRNSKAYMTMGNIGFEQAVVDKIRQENPGLPVYDSSRGINFIRGTHGNATMSTPTHGVPWPTCALWLLIWRLIWNVSIPGAPISSGQI